MRIKKQRKEINLGKVKKVNLFGEIMGLMFSRREKAEILLFEFRKPTKMKIHSYFVFFPFFAIWLDENNKIIEIRKIKPFEAVNKIKKPYSKLVEIPINKKNKNILQLLVGN